MILRVSSGGCGFFFASFRGLEFSLSRFQVQNKCTAYCTVVLTVTADQLLKLLIRFAIEVQTSGRGTKEIHILVL